MGVAQTTPHTIAFMPSSPPPFGQPGQPSCAKPVMSEAIAICADIPLA